MDAGAEPLERNEIVAGGPAQRLGTTQKYVWELEAGKPSIMMDRLFAAMRETGMELSATITPPDHHG